MARWAQAAGVGLASPLDGATTDLGPLSILDEAVSGADLVFLGELNHFVHEKSDFRLLFARYLLSRGFKPVRRRGGLVGRTPNRALSRHR